MKSRVVSLMLCVTLLFGTFSTYAYADSAKVYRKSEGSGKKIALTFDDGPHPRYTPQILAVLEEYGVDATFFVIGQNAKNYPEAMRLIVESGCEIGNHTYSHKNMRSMSSDDILREIGECRQTLIDGFGVDPILVRPPNGTLGTSLEKVSTEMDYDIILWSIDTHDWANTPATKIAQNVLSNAKGGDIILMHDYVSGNSQACRALRLIIPEMLERGYEFVTVSELIADEI